MEETEHESYVKFSIKQFKDKISIVISLSLSIWFEIRRKFINENRFGQWCFYELVIDCLTSDVAYLSSVRIFCSIASNCCTFANGKPKS